jgi:hypothetical protein
MAKAAKRTNPISLQAGMSIGTNAAEFDDDVLFDCFVHSPQDKEEIWAGRFAERRRFRKCMRLGGRPAQCLDVPR